MGAYSDKINFERAIIHLINEQNPSSKELIGLSDNAIMQWWAGVHAPEEHDLLRNALCRISEDYGFTLVESNSLREFPSTPETLETLVSKLKQVLRAGTSQ